MSFPANRIGGAKFLSLAMMLTLLATGDDLQADVTTIGVVTPTPPTVGGVFGTDLQVGTGDDEESNDIWGLVSIDDGTLLQYGQVIIGEDVGYFGQVDVTGTSSAVINTQLILSSSGGTSNPTVQVGYDGTGWLNVTDSAKMTLTNNGGNMSIGTRSSGIGYATISDQFTFLTLSDSLFVGQSGFGDLQVRDGAFVRLTSFSSSRVLSIGTNVGAFGNAVVDGLGTSISSAANLRVGDFGQGSLTVSNGGLVNVNLNFNPILGSRPSINIGTNATGAGTVIVEDSGSRLQTYNSLTVGDLGVGTLSIKNGGVVNLIDKAADSVFVGTLGRIELQGGSLLGSTPPGLLFGTNVAGHLGGSGLVQGSVFVDETGRLVAQKDEELQFHGDVSNQGSLTVNGGVARFLGGFTNNATGVLSTFGRISLENGGTTIFTQPLVNDGVISNAHGTTNVHGSVTNNGDIVVARDTVATYYDTITNNGTITILPGGNLLELANMSFMSMSLLQLGVGSAELNDGNSQVTASGAIELGGTLQISLDGGLDSFLGQSLELISAGGGIVGQFDEIQLPLVPNDVDVNLVYGPTGVSMEVIPLSIGELPGDYNSDGIVDAADYTVWRDNLGSTTSLANDDTPGVGQDDYMRWKAHFGQEAIVGAGAVTSLPGATPEPSCAILLTATLPAAWFARRRRFARTDSLALS